MLRNKVNKSSKTIFSSWTLTNSNSWQKVNYHFGDRPLFGYQKEEKFVDPSLISVDNVNEKQLINEFRTVGHFLANINPLEPREQLSNQLKRWPNQTSLLKAYLDKIDGQPNLNKLVQKLTELYCKDVGIEFMHITNVTEREWIARYWEQLSNEFSFNDSLKRRCAEVMIKSEAFDEFLAIKFPSLKRYGAEGAESMMVFFDELFRQTAYTNPSTTSHYSNLKPPAEHSLMDRHVTDIVIGMPHRGRLNFLTILNQFPEQRLFAKLKGRPEFDMNNVDGLTGDVVSHMFNTVNLQYNDQGDIINDQTNTTANSLSKLDILENRGLKPAGNIHVSLLPNPSHLESISPVSSGKVRAKLLSKKLPPYYEPIDVSDTISHPVLSLQVHGDSSFSGQGVIAEQLLFSQFPHFTNFGSIHLIVNNQVGYTMEGRVRDGELVYTSNMMKAVDCPILHVNGSNPEEVVKSVRFALKYREMFHKDVLIDLICFRKHGHNELDQYDFTNCVLYKKIKIRQHSIPVEYALNGCNMSEDDIKLIKSKYTEHLNEQLELANDYKVENDLLHDRWSNCKFPKKGQIQEWSTGINSSVLRYVGLLSMNIPKDFNLHKSLNRIFQNRIEKIRSGSKIDWALAETFAFATLMYQGYNVRLSGQDVGRGTFSQRHMSLVDQENDETYIPLNALSFHASNEEFIKQILSEKLSFELDLASSKRNDTFGSLEIANSTLSEEAVLGFEYGFALESPKTLPIFEAQFGDFFNGDQIIFDTLITSGEAKWGLQNGLVVLLPHGMDGAGSEHSSARIERFLQMSNSSQTHFDSDLVNMEIVHPTTPANYFHLLRRQMLRNYRKPVIVFSPKMLLRHPECVSELSEFEETTVFRKIIFDQSKSSPKKLILCSGKHYYTLKEHMNIKNINDVAIIRIEQLSPFPGLELKQVLEKFSNCKDIVWSQEEHRNQGAYEFINTRIRNLFNLKLRYAGRNESPVIAVGISEIHRRECEEILDQTFQ